MWDDIPGGATPLDPDEIESLIPTHIRTRGELDQWEQENILAAERWLFSPRTRRRIELTRSFVVLVHTRMFDRTWRWAGQFRRTERNIGVDPRVIAVELRGLLDDAQYWLANGTYDLDEVAARLHHRLVAIHPFPNGNGRHARMFADAVLFREGKPRFSWGSGNLLETGELRRRYLGALRAADAHDIRPLLEFVRS
jgi:Fic-DOC domain mobile mystery protein B